jgi:hypothetical protein
MISFTLGGKRLKSWENTLIYDAGGIWEAFITIPGDVNPNIGSVSFREWASKIDWNYEKAKADIIGYIEDYPNILKELTK